MTGWWSRSHLRGEAMETSISRLGHVRSWPRLGESSDKKTLAVAFANGGPEIPSETRWSSVFWIANSTQPSGNPGQPVLFLLSSNSRFLDVVFTSYCFILLIGMGDFFF